MQKKKGAHIPDENKIKLVLIPPLFAVPYTKNNNTIKFRH